MKKLALILFVFAMTFSFTSCSSEEDSFVQEEAVAKSLLESYTLTRDDRGSYSLTSKVAEGVSTEVFKNEVSNTNEIHLYENNMTGISRQTNNTLERFNDQLSITFFDESGAEKAAMTVIDDVTYINKNNQEDGYFLNSYSVVSNADGTYQFNFKVKESVNVAYGYNEEEGSNKVYLTDNGTAKSTSYSKMYSVDANGKLKVDFVNIAITGKTEKRRLRPVILINE